MSVFAWVQTPERERERAPTIANPKPLQRKIQLTRMRVDVIRKVRNVHPSILHICAFQSTIHGEKRIRKDSHFHQKCITSSLSTPRTPRGTAGRTQTAVPKVPPHSVHTKIHKTSQRGRKREARTHGNIRHTLRITRSHRLLDEQK